MKLFSYPFKAMGSVCEIRLYAGDAATADAAAAKAEKEVRRLEAKYSRYREDSMTTRINRAAAQGGVDVDAETAGLLDYAQTAFEQSGGLFDITSGVLRRAWDFKAERVPAQSEIDALLPLIGWQRVEWRRPHLRLPLPGIELDFGGFVKEFAADVAARACRESGASHGFVELGGDIAIVGPHPDGSAWQVGVRDPRDPERAIATIELLEGAIASSGDYERYFEKDGRRYCHILNPHSGQPAQGLSGVSVIAPQCLIAGTASTVAMLKGREEGPRWLAALGLPYFCVDSAGNILRNVAASA